MYDLIQLATSPSNIIYTILLVVIVFYWLSVIIGALDVSSFDIDIDTDLDIDTDVDIDADADMETGGVWLNALRFFNLGKLPFMIIMTFTVLFSWTINMLISHYLGNTSIVFGLALLFPTLFISLCLTKLITSPLIPLFANLDGGEKDVDYIGLTCTIRLDASTSAVGQAEVYFNNNSLLINIKASEDTPVLTKGEEAIIIAKENDCFIAKRI